MAERIPLRGTRLTAPGEKHDDHWPLGKELSAGLGGYAAGQWPWAF
jgi:hypothetical protein